MKNKENTQKNNLSSLKTSDELRSLIFRVSMVVFFTTAISSVIFQGTTFAIPKIFEERLSGITSSASVLGSLALFVFAIASFAQIIVGKLLDKIGPKRVFLIVALIQLTFFILFVDQYNWIALFVALMFMLGAFGQIPINDYMIGKMAKSDFRARVYAVRYVISFAVWVVVVPLISFVHLNYGFDYLFYILAICALSIIIAVMILPSKLPATTSV